MFEKSSQLAGEIDDKPAALDCQRLSAFCHEQDGNKSRAWQGARLALESAQELTASERVQGNLDALVQLVQRLAADQPHDEARAALAQLAQLQRKAPAKEHADSAVSGSP